MPAVTADTTTLPKLPDPRRHRAATARSCP